MNTLTSTAAQHMKSNSNAQAMQSNGWFAKQTLQFEKFRFGMMTIYITAQSCLGSIACMYILQQNTSDIWLMLCAGVTMGSNATFIAQGPAKWCLIALYTSVLTNTLLILGTFLF